jgi:hypothetical protein
VPELSVAIWIVILLVVVGGLWLGTRFLRRR